eukprot:TRINITY_DN2606_c0_g3_i1.p1 TRINITY_DN2606_c0_g3~~TRINITY_DN2606_c0_g3_i1.p1  ORF type:complete len:344 (-),score=114.96 TRINITY_DN2606_c0_g3_i1:143-1174(-)
MDEESLMKSMGLPTSFNGKSNRTKRKRSINNNKENNEEYNQQNQSNKKNQQNKRIIFPHSNENDKNERDTFIDNQNTNKEINENNHYYENNDDNNFNNNDSFYNNQNNNNEENMMDPLQEKYLQNFDYNEEEKYIISKFWKRRYQLFSLFDEGIRLDIESWYSVTPEKLAVKTANRCKCKVILDAFCGVGGNTIQFAKVCDKVISIEINKERLELCKNNAKIYGVYDKIEFINGDFMQLAAEGYFKDKEIDIVFLAPPWGGISYMEYDCFFLNMMPIDGIKIFEAALPISKNIAYCLPKNINSKDLINLAGEDGVCEVNVCKIRNKNVFVVAYFGDVAKPIIY